MRWTFRLVLFFIVNTFVFYGCESSTSPSSPSDDRIALYSGVGIWDESFIALREALRNSGFTVDTIDVLDVLSNVINDYRIIVVPGCDPYRLSTDLGSIGRENIRHFVLNGGGFLGIAGGATVADSDTDNWIGIGLFSGNANWPINLIAPYPEYTLTDVRLVDPFHPVGNGGRDYYSTLYRWGPEFIERIENTVDVIYCYESTDTPAAVSFRYSFGCVVLIGFHPEFEENDDRDSTDFGQDLTDSDSEWDIIDRSVSFLLER